MQVRVVLGYVSVNLGTRPGRDSDSDPTTSRRLFPLHTLDMYLPLSKFESILLLGGTFAGTYTGITLRHTFAMRVDRETN